MNYNLILFVMWFLVGTSVLGTVFAFFVKDYEAAIANYIWSWLFMMCVLTVDVMCYVTVVPGETVTLFGLTLDVYYLLILSGMLLLCYKYNHQVKHGID